MNIFSCGIGLPFTFNLTLNLLSGDTIYELFWSSKSHVEDSRIFYANRNETSAHIRLIEKRTYFKKLDPGRVGWVNHCTSIKGNTTAKNVGLFLVTWEDVQDVVYM